MLWAASSQPGSLYPAVPIVVELIRRGHRVTALSDPAAESTFTSLGCAFLPESNVGKVPPPVRPLTRSTKAEWWSAYALALFADTKEALGQANFDVVLADPLETGADFAAEAVGVPVCSYVHWGLDERGPDVPFSFHLWDQVEPIDTAFVNWWNGLRSAVGLPPESRSPSEHRWYRTSPALTLLLGLPELVEPLGDLPPGVVRVGPTVWDPPTSDPLPEWTIGVGKHRPAVLASVSTVGSSEDTAVIATIAGAAGALDLELIVTVPIKHDLQSLPGTARVAPFIPHGSLIDRVSVFVNHAGNGSVNRAACAGVPVLLLPTGRDQFQVARGATAAGFAITLQPDQRSLHDITEALERLTTDASFRGAARSLAQRATTYNAPKSAVEHIEHLAHAGG